MEDDELFQVGEVHELAEIDAMLGFPGLPFDAAFDPEDAEAWLSLSSGDGELHEEPDASA